MQNNTPAQKLSVSIAAYCALKYVLNTVMGGLNLKMLLITAVIVCILVSGKPRYGNIVCGVLLAAYALIYLPDNIRNIMNGSVVYLLEGIVDLVFAVLLFVRKDMRGRFSQDV